MRSLAGEPLRSGESRSRKPAFAWCSVQDHALGRCRSIAPLSSARYMNFDELQDDTAVVNAQLLAR